MKKAKKSLGQNFLIDKNIIHKITKQTKIQDELIIEIGPGYGNLTDEIIKKKPKKLILIEKDTYLFNYLKTKYINNKNIKIYNHDALKYNFKLFENVKIISNLPYNISSKLIIKLIFLNNIKIIICMIQKELANKFNYKKEKMNKYKFITQLCSEYEILFEVSKNVFIPHPKVKSNLVKFKLKKNLYKKDEILNFVNKIFFNKRKNLRNKINNKNNFSEIFLNKRIEDLNFDEILKIYKLS